MWFASRYKDILRFFQSIGYPKPYDRSSPYPKLTESKKSTKTSLVKQFPNTTPLQKFITWKTDIQMYTIFP